MSKKKYLPQDYYLLRPLVMEALSPQELIDNPTFLTRRPFLLIPRLPIDHARGKGNQWKTPVYLEAIHKWAIEVKKEKVSLINSPRTYRAIAFFKNRKSEQYYLNLLEKAAKIDPLKLSVERG